MHISNISIFAILYILCILRILRNIIILLVSDATLGPISAPFRLRALYRGAPKKRCMRCIVPYYAYRMQYTYITHIMQYYAILP
jgi:hypothetical protein